MFQIPEMIVQSFANVIEVVLTMWAEIVAIAFFTLGFICIQRCDPVEMVWKRCLALCGEKHVAFWDVIEKDVLAGRYEEALAHWKTQVAQPTPSTTLKHVVKAIVQLHPENLAQDIIQHMKEHATLRTPEVASVVVDAAARAGHLPTMQSLTDALEYELQISLSLELYESLLGGYAAGGDDVKVREILALIKKNRWSPTVRGCLLVIKGFVKCCMLDVALALMLEFRQHHFVLPASATAHLLRLACRRCRTMEVLNQVQDDISFSVECIVVLCEGALRCKDFALARRAESLARERNVPLHRGAYENLLKVYAINGDEGAVSLFQEMQHSVHIVSEGFCTILINQCTEAMFPHLATEVLSLFRKRRQTTLPLYSAVSRLYVHCGMYSEVSELFDQAFLDGFDLGPVIWTGLMQCESDGRCARDDEKLQVLAEKIRSTTWHDVSSYNAVLKSFCHTGNWQGAKDVFAKMERDGVVPNSVACNRLVGVAAGLGDPPKAWESINMMDRSGIAPDQFAVSTVFKALRKDAGRKDLDRAFELLDPVADDVVRDEVLLNSTLEACIANHADERIAHLVGLARKSALQPSVHTYATLIKAAGRLRDATLCKELWREMVDLRHMNPNEVSLGCMLDALVSNEHVEDAICLMNKWKTRLQPNTVMYSTLIKGFASERKPNRAMDLWREMRANGVPMNNIAYNSLIDAQARIGAMDQVLECIEHMQKEGLQPDAITHSTVVKGYCVSGDLDRALQVFRSMQADGMAQNPIIYNTVLDGCTRFSRVDLVQDILRDMDTYCVVPSNCTLSILVKLYGRVRQLGRAFEVVMEFPQKYGFVVNAQVKTCLLSACIHNGDVLRAFCILEDLKRSGPCSLTKAYSMLILSCVRNGMLQEAVNLVDDAHGLGCPKGTHTRGLLASESLDRDVVGQLVRALQKRGLGPSVAEPLLARYQTVRIHQETRR